MYYLIYVEMYRSGHNGAHSKCVSPPGHAGSNPAISVIGKPHKLSVYAVFPCPNDFYGRNKIPAVLLFSDYCYHDFQDNTAVKHPSAIYVLEPYPETIKQFITEFLLDIDDLLIDYESEE